MKPFATSLIICGAGFALLGADTPAGDHASAEAKGDVRRLLALQKVSRNHGDRLGNADGVQLNDIWLAVRKDGRDGAGTLMDPRDASTTVKFDRIFTPPVAHTTYHLLPGTYTTKGARFGVRGLTKGNRLVGSGTLNTVVKLDPGWVEADAGYNAGNNVALIGSVYTGEEQNAAMENVVVSDLTLDCNYTNIVLAAKTNKAFGHLELAGRNSLVERVLFIGGADANGPGSTECFAVDIMGSNSVVRDCVLKHWAKNTGPGSLGVTFFALGHSGTLENCELDVSDLTSLPVFYGACVSFYRHGTAVRRNRFVGAADNMSLTGLYADTVVRGEETRNWLVDGNEFINVNSGVAAVFNAVRIEGCQIVNNYFKIMAATSLDSPTDSGALKSDIGGTGGASWQNCTFSRNTVEQTGSGHSAVRFTPTIVATNLFMSDNVFASGMLVTLPTTVNVIGENNLMSDGSQATNTRTGLSFGVTKVNVSP